MTDHVPRDCPKFDRCECPLCPLDKDWHKRAVMPNEPVCPYLLELDKPGDPVARFAGLYDEFVIKAAAQLRDDLTRERHPRYNFIAARIAKSATTMTMIEQNAMNTARLKRVRPDQKKVCTAEVSAISGAEPPQQVSSDLPGGV